MLLKIFDFVTLTVLGASAVGLALSGGTSTGMFIPVILSLVSSFIIEINVSLMDKTKARAFRLWERPLLTVSVAISAGGIIGSLFAISGIPFFQTYAVPVTFMPIVISVLWFVNSKFPAVDYVKRASRLLLVAMVLLAILMFGVGTYSNQLNLFLYQLLGFPWGNETYNLFVFTLITTSVVLAPVTILYVTIKQWQSEATQPPI